MYYYYKQSIHISACKKKIRIHIKMGNAVHQTNKTDFTAAAEIDVA